MARPITRVSNLQIKSDSRNRDKGFYPDNLTTVQRDLIPTKTNGLLIFNIDTKTHQTYIDGTWNNLVMPGGVSTLKRIRVATNYIMLPTDCIVGVDATAVTRTIILPPIGSTVSGQFFIIVDELGQAATNNITINTNGAPLDGSNDNRIINTNYSFIRLYSTGTAWVQF